MTGKTENLPVVLITGALAGIGRATHAVRMQLAGFRLLIFDARIRKAP